MSEMAAESDRPESVDWPYLGLDPGPIPVGTDEERSLWGVYLTAENLMGWLNYRGHGLYGSWLEYTPPAKGGH